MLAEVDEQPQVESGGLEIVVNLGSVLIGQDGHGFDFNDHLAMANKIGFVVGQRHLGQR